LLGDFEAVGLGAFGVIRPQVHVDDRPAVFVGDLGAEAVDIVVVAADAHHVSGRRSGAEHFALLQIVGIITKQRMPAWAAWAAVLLARLPVLAQPTVSKPNSIALLIATETTRSL
jgi:hypothetical protein